MFLEQMAPGLVKWYLALPQYKSLNSVRCPQCGGQQLTFSERYQCQGCETTFLDIHANPPHRRVATPQQSGYRRSA